MGGLFSAFSGQPQPPLNRSSSSSSSSSSSFGSSSSGWEWMGVQEATDKNLKRAIIHEKQITRMLDEQSRLLDRMAKRENVEELAMVACPGISPQDAKGVRWGEGVYPAIWKKSVDLE